ncbi:hypothetical protein DVH05_004244 [Phytophthora capsici]|nr:hypothetical protein DVH05_004244 [Phytophthora capsici]
MLLGDWHGNKYPPFLIFKTGVSRHQKVQQENISIRHGFGVQLWKEVSPLQEEHSCRIYGNPTAWWNSSISLEFLRFHFGSRDYMEEKVLLLWDAFAGHWTQEVLDYAASINVVLMKVPPRYTYVCQPADVAWNHPFKSRLRKRWVECLRIQIAKHHALDRSRDEMRQKVSEEVAIIARKETQDVARETIKDAQKKIPTFAFKMSAPKRSEITSWIAEAWAELTAETIVSGFAKADLLGDTRSSDGEEKSIDVEEITEILEQLEELGAVKSVLTSDDEYVSSDSSDDEHLSL